MDLIPKPQKSKEPVLSETGLRSRGILLEESASKAEFLKDKKVKLSLAVLVLTLLIFGGFKGYEFYQQSNIEKIRGQIEEIESKQDKEMAQKILDTHKTITSVRGLLKNHIYSTQFFDALEKTTLPRVQWYNFTLLTDGNASLSGKADSYSTLAKQIIAFEEAKFKISVSGISYKKDGVEFSATTEFDPKIFLKE